MNEDKKYVVTSKGEGYLLGWQYATETLLELSKINKLVSESFVVDPSDALGIRRIVEQMVKDLQNVYNFDGV